METSQPPSPAAQAAALADAEATRARLAQEIVAPPSFFVALGAVIAVQIATTAVGLGAEEPVALVAGLLVFAGVAALLLLRFRRENGVWVGGFASRVVLGTGTGASTAYAVALGAAIWAAYESAWWLVALCSLAGGIAYALSGIRWLRTYRDEPAAHSRGESKLFLALVGLAALGGLALLLAGS